MTPNNTVFKSNFSPKALSLSIAAAFTLLLPGQATAKLSMENVTRDITYLASDDLKGRASFSPEIDQAADYISQRFSEIGLTPMAGNSNFKQSFSIYSISPKALNVSLNGQGITPENLTMASTMETFRWQQANAVKTHTVAEKDDLREIISGLNQQGGQHLVLVHPAHKDMFKRYQHYFNRGLTKLELGHQGAIVMALTEITKPNQLDVTGTTATKKQRLTNVAGILPGKSKPEEIVL